MMNSVYAFRNLQRRIKTPPSPTLVLGVHVCVCANSFQSCPTLHDCMDYHPSVHEFVQGRLLEWVAIPPPGDLPDPGVELESLMSPAFFTSSTTRQAQCWVYLQAELLLVQLKLIATN